MPDPAPRPHWTTIEVAGHPCDMFVPPAPAAGRAVIYLHDVRAGRLRDRPVLRDLIEAADIPVLAPRTDRSWWIDRIVPAFDPRLTPERFLVDHVLAEAARRFGVAPPGIALIGTGMGGQGALRLAYRHPARLPVAAAIAPAIDFHRGMREAGDRDDGELFDMLWDVYGDIERARQDTAILHVHPLNWPRHQWFASDPADLHWHDGAVRLHSKLVALGIPHTALLDPRLPAATDPADAHGTAFEEIVAAEAVQFVLAALDGESRRLPSATGG